MGGYNSTSQDQLLQQVNGTVLIFATELKTEAGFNRYSNQEIS